MTGLSPRQSEVINVMTSHFERVGLWPTLREMIAVLGITSLNGISDHLRLLIKKGYVKRVGHRHVVIRLASGQRVVARLVPVYTPGEVGGEGEG